MKKIAIPVTGSNEIDGHFGHCEYYQVFSVSEQNEILDIHTLEAPQGCGCKSNIASVLSQSGVSVMLAGGIGAGAIDVLNAHGIEVVRGCTGNAKDLVTQFLKGELMDGGSSCTHHEQHHGSEGGHSCGH